MNLWAGCLGGYYDASGVWQRTKFCFVDCGDRCTCQPPNGVFQLPSTKESPVTEAATDVITDEIIAKLESEVIFAQQRLEMAKKRRIELCVHPFEELQFTAGAVESHCSGYTDRHLTARCSCGMVRTISVRWHHD